VLCGSLTALSTCSRSAAPRGAATELSPSCRGPIQRVRKAGPTCMHLLPLAAHPHMQNKHASRLGAEDEDGHDFAGLDTLSWTEAVSTVRPGGAPDLPMTSAPVAMRWCAADLVVRFPLHLSLPPSRLKRGQGRARDESKTESHFENLRSARLQKSFFAPQQ